MAVSPGAGRAPSPRSSHPGGSGAALPCGAGPPDPGPPYSPGLLLTGLFLPLQKRTLLKTPRTCLSQRERPSLLGLERRLEADTRSLLDSLACRFCRINELAIAAAIAAHGPPRAAPRRSGGRRPGALGPSRRRAPRDGVGDAPLNALQPRVPALGRGQPARRSKAPGLTTMAGRWTPPPMGLSPGSANPGAGSRRRDPRPGWQRPRAL